MGWAQMQTKVMELFQIVRGVSEEETWTAIAKEKCDNRFEATTNYKKPEQA